MQLQRGLADFAAVWSRPVFPWCQRGPLPAESMGACPTCPSERRRLPRQPPQHNQKNAIILTFSMRQTQVQVGRQVTSPFWAVPRICSHEQAWLLGYTHFACARRSGFTCHQEVGTGLPTLGVRRPSRLSCRSMTLSNCVTRTV